MPSTIDCSSLPSIPTSDFPKKLKRSSSIFGSIVCVSHHSALNPNVNDLKDTKCNSGLNLKNEKPAYENILNFNNPASKKQKISSQAFIEMNDEQAIDILTPEDIVEASNQTSKKRLIFLYGLKILYEPKYVISNLTKYYLALNALGFNSLQILKILQCYDGDDKAKLLIKNLNTAYPLKILFSSQDERMDYITAITCGEKELSDSERVFFQTTYAHLTLYQLFHL